MAIFSKRPALRQEIADQRKTVFGRKRYMLHIIMWLALLCFMMFSMFGDDFVKGANTGARTAGGVRVNGVSFTEMPSLIVSLISSVAGAIMVYFFLLLAIPFARYKKQRRYIWIGLFLNCGIWMLVFTLAAMILGFVHSGKTFSKTDTTLIFLLSAAFSGFVTALFFSLYYFLDLYDQQHNLNKYRQVLTQKLEAETNFLKTQINPHFLFNTLNNIYSLTLNQSPDAAHIARQLKDLMTYMLRDCTQDQVSLAGEVAFLKNYIGLEELRNKQGDIDIQLQIKGDTGNKMIAPLLLINFIENAFKHGVKAGVDSAFVHIKLLIMDRTLALEMVNSKPLLPEGAPQAVQAAGGIGVQNVKRRLNILYPNRHKLRINDSREQYSVYLSIEL